MSREDAPADWTAGGGVAISGAGGLAEFIAARYDEAEANAWAALAQWPDTHFTIRPGSLVVVGFHRQRDPAHRLADIALKRGILAEHAPGSDGNCATCVARNAEHPTIIDLWLPVGWPCATVRQLGTEFTGHPAYKAAWMP